MVPCLQSTLHMLLMTNQIHSLDRFKTAVRKTMKTELYSLQCVSKLLKNTCKNMAQRERTNLLLEIFLF